MNPTEPTGFFETSLGLPSTGRRPFTSEERTEIGAGRRKLLGQGILIALSWPLLVILFICAAVHADTSSNLQQNLLAGSAIFLVAVALPVAVLGSRDALSRAARLRKDLRGGEIALFEGPILHLLPLDDKHLRKALRLIDLPDGSAADVAIGIELLGASGRVWRLNGKRVAPWACAPIMQVARTPEIARIAAQWTEPSPPGEEPREIMTNRRDLTDAEISEVRRTARSTWLKRLPLAVGLSAWVSMPIAVIVLQGHLNSTFDTIHFCILGFFALTADAVLILGVIDSVRMIKDARNGFVVILRSTQAAPGAGDMERATGAEDVERLDGGPSSAPSEIWMEALPISGRVWTQGGYPAPWRMSPIP